MAALVYMVMIGATAGAELLPPVAALSGLITLPFIVAYLILMPTQSDRFDRLVLLAVLFFIAACVLSAMPRQSFEAAIAAVAFASALFVARRAFERPRLRRLLVWTLVALSATMTIFTAARWESYLVDWLTLTGWRAPPPLNMELPSNPWGHRHDVALLVVMLYPAWWIGRPSAPRRIAGVVIGVVAAAVVLVDGSRMLWIAIACAAVAAGALAARRSGVRSRVDVRVAALVVGTGIVLLALLFAFSGVGATLLDRLTNYDSVGWRTAMWSALIDSWLTDPLAGAGPGTFPWVLQGTGYFDVSSFAPRHPDSAVVQLLAEGGLLGVSALVVLLLATIPALVRSGSVAAVFALTAFGVAGIGANPTDFGFLIVGAIAWLGYAVPRAFVTTDSNTRPVARMGSPLQVVLVAGSLFVAIAWGATNLARFAYDDATSAVLKGDLSLAAEGLERAVAFDPGMALYERQLGAIGLLTGRSDAIFHLERAVSLGPADDLAWRTLAVAYSRAGRDDAAGPALGEALHLQRSDPTNLLLSAARAAEHDDIPSATAMLAEVVQAWPRTVYSSAWEPYVDDLGVETDEIIALAAERWSSGASAPELREDQGLWLAVMSGRDDLLQRAMRDSGYSPAVSAAMIPLLGCQTATEILDSSSADDIRSPAFWALRMRDAALTGSAAPEARDVVELMVRRRVEGADPGLNVLRENSVRGTSTDVWGYRRYPIDWPQMGDLLPSPYEGFLRWLDGAGCEGDQSVLGDERRDAG